MSPAERQQVIDALEELVGYVRESGWRGNTPCYASAEAALAIMRRGREPRGEALRIPGYSCGRCGCADIICEDWD